MGCPIFQGGSLVAIASSYNKESGRLYIISVLSLKYFYPNFEAPQNSGEVSTGNRWLSRDRLFMTITKCLMPSKSEE